MPYFIVRSEQGPAWVSGRPMREQAGWTEHAAFINAATDAGLLLLGGPVGPGAPHRAMVIANFPSEPDVRAWLSRDPWMRSGVLRAVEVESWELLVSHAKLDPALAEVAAARPPA
jgi:uncharacterized protein YciI